MVGGNFLSQAFSLYEYDISEIPSKISPANPFGWNVLHTLCAKNNQIC
jgi:hypothetical protein